MGNQNQGRQHNQGHAAKALHQQHMGGKNKEVANEPAPAYISDDDISQMRNEGDSFPTAAGAIAWLRKQVKKDQRGTLSLYFSVIKTILKQSIDDVIDEVIVAVKDNDVKILLHPTSYDGRHFFFCLINQRDLKIDRQGDEEVVKAKLDVNIMISDFHDSLEARMHDLKNQGKTRTRDYIALSKEVLVQNTISTIEANVVEALMTELSASKGKEHRGHSVYGASIQLELVKTGEQLEKEPTKLDPEEEEAQLGDAAPENYFAMLAAHVTTCKSPTLAKSYSPSAPREDEPQPEKKGNVATDFFSMMRGSFKR